jgi:hypothetical protein
METFDPTYEKFVNDIWMSDLIHEYHNINNMIEARLGKRLQVPELSIEWTMGAKWGEWNPTDRRIRLNAILFRDFEPAAVTRVLKHEMGHQIVSDIFHQDKYGCVHGEFWKLACQAIDMDCPTRCDSPMMLAGLKGSGEESPIIRKIKGCFAKGRNEGASEAEMELFLGKAQELMMKHCLTEKDLVQGELVWNKRPIGEHYKRWPSWMNGLLRLLEDFYKVKRLRKQVYINNIGMRYYGEIYGTTENLDMAEYVFYAVLNNGKELFKKAVEEHEKKLEEDDEYAERWVESRDYENFTVRYRRFTFASFMDGLVDEYSMKVRSDKCRVEEEMTSEDKEKFTLISMEDEKLLEEMHKKVYPKLCHFRQAGPSGAARGAGRAAGSRLNIGRPMGRGSMRRLGC